MFIRFSLKPHGNKNGQGHATVMTKTDKYSPLPFPHLYLPTHYSTRLAYHTTMHCPVLNLDEPLPPQRT